MKMRLNSMAAGAAILLAAGPAAALTICAEGAYPPFSETAPDGTLKGFDIDIARAVAFGRRGM